MQEWLQRRVHSPAATAFLVTLMSDFALAPIVAFAAVVLTSELAAAYDTRSRRSLATKGAGRHS
jgi:hypothetical protein